MRNAYDEALQLAGKGPVVVLNEPKSLMIWSTHRSQLSEGQRAAATHPNAMVRVAYQIGYARDRARAGMLKDTG